MDQPLTPSPSSSTLVPGSRFGAYEIIQRLGAGGMGEVYRARDTRLGREVAIKTVSLGNGSQADSVQRFEQEARSASSLNHPNIVTIYEMGQVDGTHYFAMELVVGDTIRDLLNRGPIPFRKVIHIAAQVADALAKAHEIGIVHRDLKPENLIVSADDIPKIVDFGLAKLLAPDPAPESATVIDCLTQPGMVLGSMGYMAPEQAKGTDVDFRSDQFSFATVLYEMVTGHPAFRRQTRAETMAAVLRDDPSRIETMNVEAPAPFIWIVQRCLAKDPKDRYGSTRDLARELAAIRDGVRDAPLPSLASRPTNLPVPRTAFIGRDLEAQEVRDLVLRDDVRLITLTGPGGIGKTRLALQVAGEVSASFPGGICFVPLSSVTDGESIPAAMAQTFGLRTSASQSSLDAVKDYVRTLPAPMLLLLDNFEHLVAAAPLIADLISAGPNLKIVVTSQSPLHVYGEQEFPVPPLTRPDLRAIPPLPVLAQLPAVALFVERAQAVKRDFALTRENAAAVASICARVDGLPLAIELAAARIKLLSPSAMQARIESSLNLLTGGARDLPTRQQTLRGTIDWSYRLLNEAEQTLFRRISVFVGGCTLEGVEAVCDTKGDLGIDVLDGMASMVDKSLVQQANEAEGEARFVMLSTIREYALERLGASGEEHATRRAHAAYCIVLAEESGESNSVQSQWLPRFDLEHDNFRAALDHLLATKDAEWGLRLAAALFRYWETREFLKEGRDSIEAFLKLPAIPTPKLRARALFAAGVLAGEQGDYQAAHAMMQESLETSRGLQDTHGIAVALNALAVNARDQGEIAAAAARFEESLAMWRELGDPVGIARALSNLANIVTMQGDHPRARSLYDESLSIFRAIGDESGVAWSLNYQGDVAREQRDLPAAESLYEQSLAAFRGLGDQWGMAGCLLDLANLKSAGNKFSEAHLLRGESLRIFQELGHKRGIARVLESLAGSAAQSDPRFSLRMAGAAAALRQRIGGPLTPAEQSKLDKVLEASRQKLSRDAGTTAWMEGWALPLDEAIEEALENDGTQSVGVHRGA